MACINCGRGGTKQGFKKLPIIMIETLQSRGFRFVGSCNCHGGNTKFYEHDSYQGFRMEVSTAAFWIKQRISPNPNWNTIDFGNQQTFDEKLNKYFPQ